MLDIKTSQKHAKAYTFNENWNNKCQKEMKEAIESGRLKVWKMSDKEKAYYDRI